MSTARMMAAKKRSEDFPQTRGFSRPNYTMVPDQLFDVFMPHLKEGELKVLLYIIRRTFGFKKESDSISFSQICNGIRTRDGKVLDSGTGLSPRTAQEAVKSLVDKKLIVAKKNYSAERGNEATTYALNLVSDEAAPYATFRHSPPADFSIAPTQNLPTQETVVQQTDVESSGIPDLSLLSRDLRDLLAQQVTRATFDSHLRRVEVIEVGDEIITLNLPTPQDHAWISNRLQRQVARAVEALVGRPLDIIFVVRGEPAPDTDP